MLTGGRAVTLIHRGPYETIGSSYRKLIDYVNENGVRIQCPTREMYIKGPGFIIPRSPKRFITEIQFMIDESQ